MTTRKGGAARLRAGKRAVGRGTAAVPSLANMDSSLNPATELSDRRDDQPLIDVRIAFLMHDVSRMRRSAYEQIMKPVGITRAQWWVLAHLSRHDGMMQTQLADLLEVGKASVGALLKRLEAAKLIERRPDSLDLRAKRVYMLRAAHQVMKILVVEEARFNERILASLSLAERKELLRMLSQIKKALLSFGVEPAADEED